MSCQAIVLWLDDAIISGSVVPVSKMKHKDPENASVDFKEGDIVMAPCYGFPGKHRCVIAKIGPEGETEKKRLMGLINSSYFNEMVEEYASPHLKQADAANGTCTANTQMEETCTEKESGKLSLEDEDKLRKKNNPKKLKSTEVGNNQPEAETDAQKRKKQKMLQQTAAELELTELSAVIGNANRTVLNEGTEYKTPTTSSDTCSSTGHNVDSQLVLPAQPHESSVDLTLHTELAQSKQMIHTLQNRVNYLEGSLTNLWNWTRQIQQEQRLFLEQQQQQQTFRQPSQQDVFDINMPHASTSCDFTNSATCGTATYSCSTRSSSATSSGIDTTSSGTNSGTTAVTSNNTDGDSSDVVVGGYTMCQLECKVAHLTSPTKVAALLFRTLFKEEEYIGKTLTGAGGKPKVDQEKLAVVYSITLKKFPAYPATSLRHSLCDLLKPSRHKKN